MNEIKLYTYEQMSESFRNGRQKGHSDLTGNSVNYPSFHEYVFGLPVRTVRLGVLEETMRQSSLLIAKGAVEMTPEAIILSVTTCTRRFEELDDIYYSDLIENTTRKRKFIFPQQVCFYFMAMHTRLSYERIGQFFQDRPHDVVIKGARNVRNWLNLREETTTAFVQMAYEHLRGQGSNIYYYYRHPEDLLTLAERKIIKT